MPIANTGNWVHKSYLLQFRNSGLPLIRLAEFPKSLHRTDDLPLGVKDSRRANRNPYSIPEFVPQVHDCVPRLRILQSFLQRAAGLAQLCSLIVHVEKNVVGAGAMQELFRGIAGQRNCAVIPLLDPSFPVNEVNSLEHSVEYVVYVRGILSNETCRTLANRGFHNSPIFSRHLENTTNCTFPPEFGGKSHTTFGASGATEN